MVISDAWTARFDQARKLAKRPAVATTLLMLISFVVLHNLYQAAATTNYFVEIIAALMGAIVTIVITAMLLSAQSKGEELKDRNVEVFKKKVAAYEAFIDKAMEFLNDWKIDENEAIELRAKAYKLALFSSDTTMETVVRFLRHQCFEDNPNTNIGEVVAAFRSELELADALGTYDLSALDGLLRTECNGKGGYKGVLGELQELRRTAVRAFESKTKNRLEVRERVEFDAVEGNSDGAAFYVWSTGWQYQIQREYAGEKQDLVVYAHWDEEKRAAWDIGAPILQARGFAVFSDVDGEETRHSFSVMLRDDQLNTEGQGLTVTALAEAVFTVEQALGGGGRGKRSSPTKLAAKDASAAPTSET